MKRPIRLKITGLVLGACLCLGGFSPSAAQGQDACLIKGAKLYTCGTGGVLENASILIRNGRIAKILRSAETPPDVPIIDATGMCVIPGLVDAHSFLGSYERLLETTEAVMSDPVAVTAFDAFHPEVLEALEAGVTTVNLSPREESLVGGVSSIIKLSADPKMVRTLKREAFLAVSLTGSALKPDRAPTSLMGARGLLADACAAANGNAAATKRGSIFRQLGFRKLAEGKIRPMTAASRFAEINTALEWYRESGISGPIVGGEEAHRLIPELKSANIPVLLSPLSAYLPECFERNAAELAGAGIRIAFISDGPEGEPRDLRLSALALYGQGMSQERSLKTITINPAEILGVSDTLGSIEEGKDADLIIFSGEPLDLSSRIIAVYVDGRPVMLKKGK